MAQIKANNIMLEYEAFGDPQNPCVLLIMGLGTQLTAWPLSLCDALVERGYFVVRYDNRDIGLSARLDEAGVPRVPIIAGLAALGIRRPTPYSLDDMALDAVGLLDALGIASAHVVGASMGGMIAQLVAATHPKRTLSLTSIMSTTGHRSLPRAEKAAMQALLLQPDDPNDMESVKRRNMRVRRVLQSPAYAQTDAELERTVSDSLARGGYNPDGVSRQLAAIVVAKHRRQLLKRIKSPALVIHGVDDPLVKLACGEDTAKHIPRSRFVPVTGMGHDLPEPLMADWADMIHEMGTTAG